jgi:hypothetical protein
MGLEPGDWAVGVMMTVFGFAGLFLAAGARDDEMVVFGWSLVGFAVAFVFGLINRHFARLAAKPALVPVLVNPDV